MKAVTVLLDEPLLRRLDAHGDVKRLGRSAVMRLAADDYLRRRKREPRATAYRRAYPPNGGIDDEFGAWSSEGCWD